MGGICGREGRTRALALCTLLHSSTGNAVHFAAQRAWEVACGSRLPARRRTSCAPGDYMTEVGGIGGRGDVLTSCRIRLGLNPTAAASCRSEYPACWAATKVSR
jgi:hypothetical protein